MWAELDEVFFDAVVARVSDDRYNLHGNFDGDEVTIFETGAAGWLAEQNATNDPALGVSEFSDGGNV